MGKADKSSITINILELLTILNKGEYTNNQLQVITGLELRTVQRYTKAFVELGIVTREKNVLRLSTKNDFASHVGRLLDRRFIAAYIDILKDIPLFTDTVESWQSNLKSHLDIFTVITKRPMTINQNIASTITSLYNHIISKNKIKISYDNKQRVLSPYRIVYNNGFWYLAGVTERNKNLIKIRLDSITDVRKACFEDTSDGIIIFRKCIDTENIILKASSIWFNEDKVDVTLAITGALIDTFQKRQLFNNQQLYKSNDKFYAKFTVANFQDFFSQAAHLMPLFDIIEPLDFKDELKNKLVKYV